MSRNGQTDPERDRSSPAIRVTTFPMASGTAFEWHSHRSHQLAWADSGVLTVQAEAGTWVLPPTRALWIPAGVAHETIASGSTTMRAVYLQPGSCSVQWSAPQPLAATRLLAELIVYLADVAPEPPERGRAEALLLDLLEPVDVVTIAVVMPTDERAHELACALLVDPADPRSLQQWGRHLGASARTLSRGFLDGTGITFSRWRTAVRIRAALPRLAAGEPISAVAPQVGYQTASAFVAAFRRETGTTPGAYFRTPSLSATPSKPSFDRDERSIPNPSRPTRAATPGQTTHAAHRRGASIC